MTIIISRSGRNARVIERSVIEKEEYLQEYIHENPGSIPIYEIKENRKLLVSRLCRGLSSVFRCTTPT